MKFACLLALLGCVAVESVSPPRLYGPPNRGNNGVSGNGGSGRGGFSGFNGGGNGGFGNLNGNTDQGFGASSINNRRPTGNGPSTNYGLPNSGSGSQGFNGAGGFNRGFVATNGGDQGFGASFINSQRAGNGNRGSFGGNSVDSELSELASSLPGGGVPGEDFPVLSEVPETRFSCEDQTLSGYYADVEAQCQAFHICQIRESGLVQQDSFLCPNGTIFNQQYFVCDWWYNFDCDTAEDLYSLNEQIGVVGTSGNGVGGFGFGDFNRAAAGSVNGGGRTSGNGGNGGLVGAASNNQNGFFGGNTGNAGNRFGGSGFGTGRFGGSGNGGSNGVKTGYSY